MELLESPPAAVRVETRAVNSLKLHPAHRHCPKMGAEWTDFLEHVRKHGIIEPIIATSDGFILDGRHRWEGAKEAGLDTVPVVIVIKDPENRAKFIYELALATKTLTAFQRVDIQRHLHAAEIRQRTKENQRQGGRGKKGGRKPTNQFRTATFLSQKTGMGQTKVKQCLYISRHPTLIIESLGTVPVLELVKRDDVSTDAAYKAMKSHNNDIEIRERIAKAPEGIEIPALPEGYVINRFICDDVFAGMKKIAPGSLALILTSPPYPVKGENAQYPGWAYDGDYRKYLRWVGEWLRDAYDLLEDSGRMGINIPRCSAQGRGEHQVLDTPSDIGRLGKRIGLKLRFPRTWFKQHCNGKRNACGSYDNPTQQSNTEEIMMFHRGSASRKAHRKNLDHKHSIVLRPDLFHKWTTGAWYLAPAYRNHTEHPCAFPVEMVRRCVLLDTYPGDTVGDIFCGSATTCWGAAGLSRNWIGIDNDPVQIKKAIKRMQTPYMEPDAYAPFPKKFQMELDQLPAEDRERLEPILRRLEILR